MQIKNKSAFTMIELIMVIVVIGILAGIAIPKFAETGKMAYISRAESTVAALRSAIATERQKRILRGDTSSDITTTQAAALLTYGLNTDNWAKTDDDTFTFTMPGGTATCAFDIVGGKLEKQSCDAATGLTNL